MKTQFMVSPSERHQMERTVENISKTLTKLTGEYHSVIRSTITSKGKVSYRFQILNFRELRPF